MDKLSQAYRRMIDANPSNSVSWTFLILLWPLSLLFRVVTVVRRALYRGGLMPVYRAAVPVVSIGNLTVGGTGKTPVTDAFVNRLLAAGARAAVVSRGYGGRFRGAVGCVAVGNDCLLLSPQDAGDEPCLLALRNPSLQVYVARKRALGVAAAERNGAQIIFLDDGFQHLAVHRDFDIVLLDGRAPFGNRQLLPAGPLRESPSAVNRADLVVLTHAVQPYREIVFQGPVLHCRHRLADSLRTLDGQETPWSALDGHDVIAFAGIARPEDFFSALRIRGVVLSGTIALNDHQDYSPEQLNRLFRSCDNKKLLITTEKDAVKLSMVDLPCPCLVAPLVLDFGDAAQFDAIVMRLLERIK